MIYPGNITGPLIKDSNLVDFVFDGAELTLPLPDIPLYDQRIDEVSTIKDFMNMDTRSWETDGLDNPCFRLVRQQWIFEDSASLDDIAACTINIGLMEVTDYQKKSNMVLNKSTFKKSILDSFAIIFADEEDENMDDPDWPKIHNQFNFQCIKKPHLDWLQIQMCPVEGRKPSPLAFIPIDSRFILNISFAMGALHYQDRQNPYSDELIRKLEFDLFDEYMQSIDLRYTEETLAIIRASAE